MPPTAYQDDSSMLTPLQLHHEQCAVSAGVVHRLRRIGEAMRSFISSHLVSALCLAFIVTSVAVSMHSGPG
jgi:hypothetical protein